MVVTWSSCDNKSPQWLGLTLEGENTLARVESESDGESASHCAGARRRGGVLPRGAAFVVQGAGVQLGLPAVAEFTSSPCALPRLLSSAVMEAEDGC